jgi:signal transduction histidine kinase/HAMP domain-containing protein
MLRLIERSMTLQLLIFYILFILPLFLIGTELYSAEHDNWQQQIQQTNLSLDRSVALTVGTMIHSVSAAAINLSTTTEAKDLDTSALTTLFQAAAASPPSGRVYVVCDATGNVVLVYPTEQQRTSEPCGSLASFRQALVSSVPLVSSLSPGSSMIPIAFHILHQSRVVGVLIIDEPVAALATQLMSLQQYFPSSAAFGLGLIDKRGNWLARTGALPTMVAPLESVLSRTLPISQLMQVQGRSWLYSLVPVIGTPWIAIVAQPADVAFAPITNLQHSLLFALVLLLGGGSLFWLVLHGWTVAPLSRLARVVTLISPQQTEKVTESKFIARERRRTDEIGQLIAAFSLMEDEIHKRFRESDEESQARLHTLDAIMQSMYEGVLLENPDGQTVYVNRSFTQFLGVPAHEASLNESHLQEKLLAMMVDPEAYQRALTSLEHSAEAQDIEFQTHGYYNGMRQWIPVRRDIRVRLFEVRDRSGMLIGRGKIFNDVTRHNEAELIKKNLLAIVSHELRTPLTAIKGYATSLLETDVELDSNVQRRFLQRIVEEEDRMADLVTNLLEMSQLEAGTLKLSSGWYHLNTILEQVIQDNEQKNIHIHVPPDLPAFYVDRRRIETVIRNLMDNARCYGGAETLIEIIATYSQDGGLSLSVIDNGPGLPPELTERIFEHFYQVDGGRQRSRSGVGLGLAICRGFVEAHGGRIWAENRSDGQTGAIFHIWLPPKLLYGASNPSSSTSAEIF